MNGARWPRPHGVMQTASICVYLRPGRCQERDSWVVALYRAGEQSNTYLPLTRHEPAPYLTVRLGITAFVSSRNASAHPFFFAVPLVHPRTQPAGGNKAGRPASFFSMSSKEFSKGTSLRTLVVWEVTRKTKGRATCTSYSARSRYFISGERSRQGAPNK